MASENKLLANKVQTSANATPEIIYTNNNARETLITAFTAANETVATRKYKVYIVPSGGTADRALSAEVSMLANSSRTEDKVIGHYIPAGGTLRVETDLGVSIHFTVSGREFV